MKRHCIGTSRTPAYSPRRIWSICAGYLDRQRLLDEHDALRRIASAPGTATHSRGDWAYAQRLRLVAAEMAFRGHDAPRLEPVGEAPAQQSQSIAAAPGEQYRILRRLYARQPAAPRIPLPRNAQELWAQHKYSVLARSQRAYREYGPRVSKLRRGEGFDALAEEFAQWLSERPGEGDLLNAAQHMWGYLDGPARREGGDARRMLAIIRQCAATQPQLEYLRSQTALTELAAW